MKEGTTMTQRQAEYMNSIERALSAIVELTGHAHRDFPRRTETDVKDFLENHYDDMICYLNGIFSLAECAVGILVSSEFLDVY